jgi:hypothetical protein
VQDFHFAVRLVFDMYQTDRANAGVQPGSALLWLHDMKTDIAKTAKN